MRRLFKASHKLWVEAQLRAPDWAQNTIISYLHQAKELLRWRPYLTIHRLEGYNEGGSLVVDYVGLKYKPTFVGTLYPENPVIRELGKVPVWQVHKLAGLPGSDLVVVVNTKGFVQRLPRQNSLTLPFYVKMTVNTEGDLEEVRSRIHRGVRQHELRLIRKYGYEYEVSQREEDFEMFYRRMYVPTMKLRHEESASLMSRRQAYQYFRRGWLHLTKRDGHFVAGGLTHPEPGNLVHAQLMGVLDADEKLIKEGALGAFYYSVIHWANQEGYQGAIFGNCVPRLKNSVFQYKRKWGSRAAYSDNVHKYIWMKIQRDTPAVRHFFKDNPLIISNEKGQLQGLIVVDNPSECGQTEQDELEKQYGTPGLNGLLVRSMTDLFNDDPYPRQIRQSVQTLVQTAK